MSNAKNKIKKIIDRWDPISLLRGGAPCDEYDHEIAMITEAAQRTNSVEQLAESIRRIFVNVFDERIFNRDFAQCLIIAWRIMSEDIQINTGDWVRTWKPGIWRIERVIDFFFESRCSLVCPKVENICDILIAKRYIDSDESKSFAIDTFDSVLSMPLPYEEINNLNLLNVDLRDFECFDKRVNYCLPLCFSVNKDFMEYFEKAVENLFAYRIEKGMANDEILEVVEKTALDDFYHGEPTNKIINFICYDYEKEESEFIYRGYSIIKK